MGKTVILTPRARRFLGCLSACGLAGSVLVYVQSFSGATTDNSWRWEVLLGIGAFAVGIPIHISTSPSQKWKFYWKGLPVWANLCNYLLVLVVIAHFVWYHSQGRSGVPEIMAGQYVLDSHGRILKVLTHAEYIALKEALLRIFATLMSTCYFMPMMYWWFGEIAADIKMDSIN